MIKLDCNKAKAQPLLINFVKAIETIVRDKVVDGASINIPELDVFRDNLIIATKGKGEEDYRFSYYGKECVSAYKVDLTGKLFTEAEFGQVANFFRSLDDSILRSKLTVYLSGVFDWQERSDHKNWYRVAMPMSKDGEICEILSCCCFD
ncbi:MAG: hypothetical protein OQJ97_00405 [Rhodospirillales bacterium]|nr:hypothetical protein [Rhodospirillales bacterium]